MLSRDGLALPITSCDADLYATIWRQSRDGAGFFTETMTGFAVGHGFSSHTVTAARRRLQDAGLIEHVLDENGEPARLLRPGKAVYCYRANLSVAHEAEKRWRAAIPQALAEIDAARLADAEVAAGSETSPAATSGTAPMDTCATYPTSPATLPVPDKDVAEVARPAQPAEPAVPADADTENPMSPPSAPCSQAPAQGGSAPAGAAGSIAEKQAESLMWVFTSCYPKAQRGLVGDERESVKLALHEVMSALGATKDELRDACARKRAQAKANNPELFDGAHGEREMWRYLPSPLDFVSKAEGLAAAIESARMDARAAVSPQETPAQPSWPTKANNVTAAESPAAGFPNPPRNKAKRTKDNTDPRELCEAILSESRYSKVSGQDMWVALCDHGINGQYMTWELPGAGRRCDAVSMHRDILERQLDLRGAAGADGPITAAFHRDEPCGRGDEPETRGGAGTAREVAFVPQSIASRHPDSCSSMANLPVEPLPFSRMTYRSNS